MKILAITLGFLFISIPAFTQTLTLNELLRFRQMVQPEVNKKLSFRGWTFVSDTKPDSVTMGKAVWAFNPIGETATAWCILFYSNSLPSRIMYNSNGGTPIKTIQQKIRNRKMEVIAEGTTLPGTANLETYQDFADNLYVIRLLKYNQPGNQGIKIYLKEDYLKNNRKDTPISSYR
ncbi:hypothetical protein [Adhaeribacter aquaticus]|uniref:hypothetical protein n=1 Tax=Adhaeribacter aquaticus TaxID=299567 RepID=UPI000412661D|nr:hypothetical protein [Adhaeribacter aquaticus]